MDVLFDIGFKAQQFCLAWDIVAMQIRIRLYSHGWQSYIADSAVYSPRSCWGSEVVHPNAQVCLGLGCNYGC